MPGAFEVGNATDDLHFLVDGLRCDDLVVTEFALAPRTPTGDGRVVFDVALEGSLRCATNAIHFTRAPASSARSWLVRALASSTNARSAASSCRSCVSWLSLAAPTVGSAPSTRTSSPMIVTSRVMPSAFVAKRAATPTEAEAA